MGAKFLYTRGESVGSGYINMPKHLLRLDFKQAVSVLRSKGVHLHLIAATDDFKLARQPRRGFPILLWEDMRSCEQVNEFLRYYLLRGAIGSCKSWEPTGRAMYDYFSFLEAHDLLWDDVDRGERKTIVAAYRDYSFHTAGMARNTIRQRLTYICAFYAFAKQQGWVQSLPYEYEERKVMRSTGLLPHGNGMGGRIAVASVMPRKHTVLKKFLSRQQAASLLATAKNPHHQIIIRLALQSGLRREELATFPLAYVVDPDNPPSGERNLRVILDPADGTGMSTKGSKARTIYVSRKLMKELHHYAVHWRGERASLNQTAPGVLFLNQCGQAWAADGKGIEAMVRNIGAKVGLKTHPHMLRHTYATHTLVTLQRNRGATRIEPLVFLQKQLGHASIMTTMEYLHIVNELADDAVLAYDEELNTWAEVQT